MQLGRNYFLYHYRILRKEFGKGASHDNRSLLGNLFGTFKALKKVGNESKRETKFCNVCYAVRVWKVRGWNGGREVANVL